jgi:phospholipase A1
MRPTLLTPVALAVLLSLFSVSTRAQSACQSIESEAERLACYDAEALLPEQGEPTLLSERALGERALLGNRFGILPHHRSYLLPVTYTDDTGGSALQAEDGLDPSESLQNVEVKFQYSFKVPVGGNFLLDDDQLFFAFTQRSLWQAYNRDLSSPFRETVYEPELIWTIPLFRPLFGGRLAAVDLGINHQSNGRGGELSRSWNRLTFGATWADSDWSVGLRLWQRIEEDAEDDDNPDIADYLGHGELRLGYKWDQYRFTSILRNGDGQTSADLSVSWPINEKLSGFVQFYNGYGETLVDYNNRMRRIGFGFILADWF